MKKIKLMIAAAVLLVGFSACNTAGDEAKKDVEVLNTYVDSIYELTPVYTPENWAVIDNGYQERYILVEKNAASLDKTEKARADASEAKYAALKAKYELNIKESEAAALALSTPDFRVVLRDRLFGEGKVGNDMQFLYVTGANLLSVYQNFVDVVDHNKNEFSREDWDEIKVLYEALGTRKNVVEPDLSSSDNRKIAGLKIKFASIKGTHRGGSKAKENREAKEQQ